YNTRSNRAKVNKTPGSKLTWLYKKKPAKGLHYSDCECRLSENLALYHTN
ncbi:11991_t:CDS:1, partial [Racocetra persica]